MKRSEKERFSSRALVARPSCIAVRTIAMYTVADASQAKLSRKDFPCRYHRGTYVLSLKFDRMDRSLFSRPRRSSPYMNLSWI
ncbi:hypothetical protein CCHR01_14563 [Colletotrichum chrysophilum]|uniref:Uncharacterized protein n=1 Tax=Colletotrichum chrysophilum TaxID=1836956 RepID=A0AAD9A7A4_9PEZI|nr:hypothetical protein CCHR01_14563 [Colletotrichum chrysophilum]